MKHILKEKLQNNLLEKIAKICLYLLIFLAPLFFLPLTKAPVEINKQVLTIFLILIAFLCYLINSIKNRKIFYPKSLLTLAILILLGVIGLSSIFSPAKSWSIFGDFIQIDTLLSFLIYGLIFFLAAVLFKREDFPKIGFCFLGGLFLITILGLFQIFGKFILPWNFAHQIGFSVLGSVLAWGIYLGFGLVMIIAALSCLKFSKIFTIVLSLIGLLIFFSLFVLNYPLLWLGMVLAMVLLLIYKLATKGSTTLPLIIIVISLFFFLANQYLPSLIKAPLLEFRPNLATTLTIAKETFKEWRFLLLGSGPANFGFNYTRFRPTELNQTDFWFIRFNQGFSFFSTLLTTLGILGILAFLFLIFSFIRQGLQTRKDEKSLIILIGVSYLLINFFFFPAFFTQFIFLFLGFGFLAIGAKKESEIEFYSKSKSQNIRSFLTFLGLILFFCLILFLLFVTGQKYISAIYYQKGILSLDLNQSLDKLNKAVKLNPHSDLYLRTLSRALLLKIQEAIQNNDSLGLQNATVSSINAARRATQLNKIDSLNWSNLANIYENIFPFVSGAESFVQENYKKAMELDSKNPQLLVDLARFYILSADLSQTRNEIEVGQEKLNKAKETLEKSIVLKSDYAPAHFQMAAIKVREGKIEEAITKLEELKVRVPFDVGLAFQLGLLYYNNNQFEKAQTEFEQAVALNENYSNARYFLGLIYDRKGEKEKAIEQFERIEKLNPDNQEVKKILANLKANKPALEGVVPPAQPPEERSEAPVPEAKELEKPKR